MLNYIVVFQRRFLNAILQMRDKEEARLISSLYCAFITNTVILFILKLMLIGRYLENSSLYANKIYAFKKEFSCIYSCYNSVVTVDVILNVFCCLHVCVSVYENFCPILVCRTL